MVDIPGVFSVPAYRDGHSEITPESTIGQPLWDQLMVVALMKQKKHLMSSTTTDRTNTAKTKSVCWCTARSKGHFSCKKKCGV